MKKFILKEQAGFHELSVRSATKAVGGGNDLWNPEKGSISNSFWNIEAKRGLTSSQLKLTDRFRATYSHGFLDHPTDGTRYGIVFHGLLFAVHESRLEVLQFHQFGTNQVYLKRMHINSNQRMKKLFRYR